MAQLKDKKTRLVVECLYLVPKSIFVIIFFPSVVVVVFRSNGC